MKNTMTKKILALVLAAMLPMSAVFSNDENKSENIATSITQSVDFSISKTNYSKAVVPTADATGAKYNSLNLEIGLSKLRLFGYAQSTYYYKRSAGVDKNALDIQRVILMADAHLTNRLSFFMMYDAVKSEMHEYYAQYEFAPFMKVR
jgi:hypothetical protein